MFRASVRPPMPSRIFAVFCVCTVTQVAQGVIVARAVRMQDLHAWRTGPTKREHDEDVYDATSRSGATTALARVLVEAGVPDQPVQVYDQGRKTLFWPSLHKMAKWTYTEGNEPLRRKPYAAYPD